jgi:hypothetical protein
MLKGDPMVDAATSSAAGGDAVVVVADSCKNPQAIKIKNRGGGVQKC